jgi:hypothetical protein
VLVRSVLAAAGFRQHGKDGLHYCSLQCHVRQLFLTYQAGTPLHDPSLCVDASLSAEECPTGSSAPLRKLKMPFTALDIQPKSVPLSQDTLAIKVAGLASSAGRMISGAASAAAESMVSLYRGLKKPFVSFSPHLQAGIAQDARNFSGNG